MRKREWPTTFDPGHPTARQVQAVEVAIASLIGHPIKSGSGMELTKTIMRGLQNATQLPADDVVTLPRKAGAA
jgi:hypothetical protein